ncbi:TPA: hypothetical protein ACRTM9_000561, partial [Aeromonas hydrophila]
MSNKVSVLTSMDRSLSLVASNRAMQGVLPKRGGGCRGTLTGRETRQIRLQMLEGKKPAIEPVFLDWIVGIGCFSPCGFSLGAVGSPPLPQATLLVPNEGVAFFHGSNASENP